MEDYSTWTTAELIYSLERDEAEDLFEAECDPDGPFRYTGEFDGWWDAMKMIADLSAADDKRIRDAILEMRASQ